MAKLTKTIAKLEALENIVQVAFDRVANFVSIPGHLPMSAKTVAKTSYAIAGVENYVILVKEDCNLKAMLKRAEKLGKMTGHYISFYSKMENQGYAYPYFCITMDRIFI